MPTRSNNFDALRLFGALLVALGHSMDIFLGYDGLGSATNNQSFGGLGLNIFCTISGYLITKSRLRNGSADFFRSRALRIFPALLVAIPLMALVMGPLVSSLSLREYYSAGGTWRFLGTLFVFPLNPSLPGVFGNAPVVGQLYSLTAELSFYILVGLLGTWRHFPKLVLVLLTFVWAIFLHTNYGTLPFSQILTIRMGDMITFFFPVRLGLLCVFYLLAGSALALAAPDPAKLTRAAPFLLAVWAIALFGQDRRVYDMIEMALLPLAVMGVGMASRYVLRIPEAIGDISYGTYIYHFAVAELVFTLTPERYRGGITIAAAIAISAFVGWLSFRFVEKRALAKKAYGSQAAISDVSVAARAAMDSVTP